MHTTVLDEVATLRQEKAELRARAESAELAYWQVRARAAEGELEHRRTLEASGLSARELQVLGLIATGATNREIGAALYVVEQTVKYHTTNIYRKIGVTSRTAAAVWALQRGIDADGSS